MIVVHWHSVSGNLCSRGILDFPSKVSRFVHGGGKTRMVVVSPGRRLGDIVEAAVSKRRSCNNSARYPAEGEGGKEEERERESVCSRRKEGRKEGRKKGLSRNAKTLFAVSPAELVRRIWPPKSRVLSLSLSKREISKLFTYDQP